MNPPIPEPIPEPEDRGKKELDSLKILDQAMHKLSEHFDAVQILVSYGSSSGTKRYEKGHGNYFARYGMLKLWCLTEEGEEWNQKVKN